MVFPLSREEHDAIKARIDGQEELIVAAAIQHKGVTVSVPRPGRHGDCINAAGRAGLLNRGDDSPLCGFITNRGRFVGRTEAGQIVLASKQGTYLVHPNNPHNGLFSEDMWGEFD